MRSHGRPFRVVMLALVLFAAWHKTSRANDASPPRMPIELLEDADLRDVFFLDADVGWAVGDRGLILHTEDGGRHWQMQRNPLTNRLDSVQFLDGQTGWAAGGEVHPYTHYTSGVVLRTQDGGRNWTPVEGLTLPALKHIHFSDPRSGWTLGNQSSMYPTGIFRTEDGGRSWTPLPAGVSGPWLSGDFRDTQRGVVAGTNGRLAVIDAPNVKASQTPELGPRPLRQVQMLDDIYGWLIGDGGLVLQTQDGGLTWQMPPGQLPSGVRRLFDFRTMATHRGHVWIAGVPGSCVLHSADGGQTWELFRTEQNLPIRSIAFVDTERGWAVGALGTILCTRDGGRSWRRQRCGGTRLALLGMFGEPRDVPMELFALESGDEGYLGYAEFFGRRDVEIPTAGNALLEDRCHAALSAVGASGADCEWRFPLRQDGLLFSSQAIIDGWNRANDGQAADSLEEIMVRKIRMWRPEVIVTEPSSPRGEQPLSHIIHQLVVNAARQAADPTRYPDHATVAGLEPWKTRKIFATDRDQHAANVTLSTAQLATRLGRSVAEQAAAGHALVYTRFRPSPTRLGFNLLLDDLPQSVGSKDIFSGIFLQAGGDARRSVGHVAVSSLDALSKAAQKRRNLEQLLQNESRASADSASWIGQVHELTRGLSAASAGDVLSQLGQRYADAGQFELAAQAFQQLVERYPDHAMTEGALVWLIQYHASGEIAWQLQRTTRFQTGQGSLAVTGTAVTGGVQQADHEIAADTPSVNAVKTGFELRDKATTAGIGTRLADRSNQALNAAKLVQRTRPVLFAEPRVQFPVSVAYRNRGMGREAERFYHRLSAMPNELLWQPCAQAELWLSHGRGLAPKPILECRPTPSRPRLDGQLDDDAWQLASPVELTSNLHDDADWPAAAMLLHDDQFLFLAVSCRKSALRPYDTTPGPRPRDADLHRRDRVEVLIDLDRDYATYYRLTIDHRGWTGEACVGHTGWDPTWYVAAHETAEDWTVEAAIPLDELTPAAPQPRDVWAVGIQRVLPGVGIQAVTQPASVEPTPEGFALFIFP